MVKLKVYCKWNEVSKVHLKLLANAGGMMGFMSLIKFYDRYGAQIMVDRSIIVDDNMTARVEDINYDYLFSGESLLVPYYGASTGTAYYIFKIPDRTKMIRLTNWPNTTGGKPYTIQMSRNGIDYKVAYTVTVNGDGLEVEYDLSNYMPMAEFLIKYNGIIYSFAYGEWVDTGLAEPLVRQDFLQFGVLDLSVIPEDRWKELGSTFDLIAWEDTVNAPKLSLTVPLFQPYKLLESPTLITYTAMEQAPVISQSVLTKSRVRFLVSLDGIVCKSYADGQWVTVPKQEILNSGMNSSTLQKITEAQWGELSNDLYLSKFILLCGIHNERENEPLLKRISVSFADITATVSELLEIATPEEGFKKSLDVDTQVYMLSLETGMAFDDVNVDYDMYTTPDRIKLRPLSFGTLVGGHQSNVMAVEVISGYETGDFNIELSVTKDGRAGIQQGNYVLLDDSIIPEYRTKIEMSLIENPFSPMYPVRFRLNAGQRRIVYIRVLPQMVNTGNEIFQVKLISRPI
jgi:hypothetical protein